MVQMGRMGLSHSVDRRQFGLGTAAWLIAAQAGAAGFGSAAAVIPARIVSTAPSSTEALFALGLGKHVVGVSDYCVYPPEVEVLPKVGSYVAPNVEAITRLRPDLVVLQKHAGTISGRLDVLRLRYVALPFGTLTDVYTGIDLLGKAAGVAERGAALNAQIRSQLNALQAKANRLGKVRVLMIADRRPGALVDMVAVGPNNYVNEMIEIAGGINVMAQHGLPLYPHISLETALRANPEVIVDLTDSHDADAEHAQVREQDLKTWNEHPELSAVRSGRVRIGTSVVLLVPGPRSPEAANIFFQYFHGDR